MLPTLISICILTKNSAATIRRCLAPLAAFDEVIVLDTGSTDTTLDIVREFPNAKIFHQDGIPNFSDARDAMAAKAANDWLLHIDSDEFVTEEFVREILNLSLQENAVYEIRRRMFYRGRPLPAFDDWIKRLYHRGATRWNGRAVHEMLVVKEGVRIKRIKSPLEHHSYHSVEQLIHKAQVYSTLFADQFHSTKRGTPLIAIGHGLWAFARFYILKGNFLRGYHGFITSYCFAMMSFLKYVKVYERQYCMAWNESER